MGLFDRFKPRASVSNERADAPPPNPADLIEQGNAFEDAGQLDQAMERYESAIRLAPKLPRAHLNRGNVLLARGDAHGAAAAYASALVHDPDYAAAHYNIGNTHLFMGDRDAALLAYARAAELKPDFVDAVVARSNVLAQAGRLDESVASYGRALELLPSSAEVHYGLGNTLIRQGRLSEGADCYRRAQALNPGYIEAHSGLGSVLQDLGQLEQAAASYRKALALNENLVEVNGNLGNVLRDLGEIDQAVACYRKVLELQPGSAAAHSNLGIALSELGLHDESMQCYRRALELDPAFAVAHNNIGSALKELGRLDEAEVSFRNALRVNPDYAEAYSNLLFLHNYRATQSTASTYSDAQRFGEMTTRQARCETSWRNAPIPDRCLRVGFVSGDLRAHPVGYFLDGALAALAAEADGRLELYAYPTYFCDDELTGRIRAHCRGWQPIVGLPDDAAARRMRDDRIDILIDLSGHTAHNRLPLFAWRPAPVQATWLGYLATTGVEQIDYLIADHWTLPESAESCFTETIWRLPESYLCFTPPAESIEVGPLPASTNGYVIFGSFNNLFKLNDDVVALWARVLKAIPHSRLYLKSAKLQEAATRQNVIDRYASQGIPGERLILEGLVPRAEYLKPFQRVDIALDPFPYPGITTSVECLWMGVPVLTLAGESFLSRQGVGLLMNAGLPQWIAADADDYVARAVALSGDLPGLAALRNKLRQQVLASPIFDASGFARHFEGALRAMWRRWCVTSKAATQ